MFNVCKLFLARDLAAVRIVGVFLKARVDCTRMKITKNPAVYKFNSHLFCEQEVEEFKYGVSSSI